MPRTPEDALAHAPRTADGPLFTESAPTAPRTLAGVHSALCKPFAQALVELKPSATTKDKSRALAAPYVDARAYQTRLDRVVGPDGWSVVYRETLSGVICRLTILGITREDVGDLSPIGDENRMTSATMQAFKRACAAFGLGRYLYSLPMVWAEYSEEKRCIVNPAGVIAQMYAALPRGDEGGAGNGK
jgi:hypothetical protein